MTSSATSARQLSADSPVSRETSGSLVLPRKRRNRCDENDGERADHLTAPIPPTRHCVSRETSACSLRTRSPVPPSSFHVKPRRIPRARITPTEVRQCLSVVAPYAGLVVEYGPGGRAQLLRGCK